ncbi:IS3 family transposase [Culicoidibacter larvae]|uniref:IS3 family transposase n=1 Tax=Culicoidibacter larvae TaxID=2579976 RepID=UPI001F557A73|nr:IS3 family transposase [Culicoidibacter larvae]
MTVINELRYTFKLKYLLAAAKIPKSSFYYKTNYKVNNHAKYEYEKKVIEEIFHDHKGRYGYRRITLELMNQGIHINGKTVLKLMKQLNLKCIIRQRKYSSYWGSIGRVARNLMKRNFRATRPKEKWVTDVTMFNVCGQRVYLSPILDLYNNEIVSYEVSIRPNYELVSNMLDKALEEVTPKDELTLHSDQGWHYQTKEFQDSLKSKGITQSMSRKGNCLDNAAMESFFGILKTEFYYSQKFKSITQFIRLLHEYIYYYNNKRIMSRLDGLSPVNFLNKAENIC